MFAGRSGLLVPPIVAAGTHVSDTFNRADDATGLGSSWTARSNILGIGGNTAYPVTTGTVACTASHNTPMGNDDVTATWTVGSLAGSGQDWTAIYIGANSSGNGAIGFWLGTASYIYTVTDWALGGGTLRTGGGASYTAGDVLTIERAGNVYNLRKNGTITYTWTDSGNVLTRDSSHRLVAMTCYNNAGNLRRIDSFTADAP